MKTKNKEKGDMKGRRKEKDKEAKPLPVISLHSKVDETRPLSLSLCFSLHKKDT